MNAILDNLNSTMTASLTGTVAETVGMTVSVADFPAPVGAVVRIERDGNAVCEGEVVGFRGGDGLGYPLRPPAGGGGGENRSPPFLTRNTENWAQNFRPRGDSPP